MKKEYMYGFLSLIPEEQSINELEKELLLVFPEAKIRKVEPLRWSMRVYAPWTLEKAQKLQALKEQSLLSDWHRVKG